MIRAIVVALFAGALCVAVGTFLGIVDFRDVGYPDSANLLQVKELVQTGRLYPPFDRPPYQVTLYGPLTYFLLAVPYAIARALAAEPQIFARLVEVGAFLACLWAVFAIGLRIHQDRRTAWLCVLFAASPAVWATWTTQIRGDLPGAACSLLAIYVCLRSSRSSQVLGAGVCAGLAIAFKQTFLAAPVAIVLWLIFQRRIKHAGYFVASAGLIVAAIYGLEAWREPIMLRHFQVLRSVAVMDSSGALALLILALRQPVILLAVLGVVVFCRRRTPERSLLLLYCFAAWALAALTLLQAGANFNYFWEPMLASSVVMAAGFHELGRISLRRPLIRAAFALLFIPTVLHDFYYLRTSAHQAASYSSRQRQWRALTAVLQGKRLLSTFADVSILGAPPELPEPFLNTELELHGLWTPQPIVDALRSGAYDVLVTAKNEEHAPQGYRGIHLWSDTIWSAVKTAYQPVCVIEDRFTSIEAWVPLGSVTLLPALEAAGCKPQTQ